MARKLLQRILMSVVLMGWAVPPVGAVMTLIPIEDPVPSEWAAPLQEFMKEIGVADTQALIQRTRSVYLGLGTAQNENSMLFRIEDASTCEEDMCLTMIGRIVGGKFVPELMLSAGGKFTVSDHAVPALGSQNFPIWLIGNKMTITLYGTPKGWLVLAGTKAPL